MKRCLLAIIALVTLAVAGALPAAAANRTLDLYFTHTRENIKVVYKRNGKYVPSALRDLNRFLRDWRRNEATKMDPELFDLLWEVQQEFGGKQIHVVSAYRSPATNQMLRKRSRGVARRSQHMAGKAIDFFIKGANISKVRQAGMKRQVGGVGYYPRSGSPFVHFDTGRVRSWPRMPRGQLSRLFPNGKTLHLPASGKPLKGYKEAAALEKAGKLQTLRGGGGGGTLLAGLLGGGRGGDGGGGGNRSGPNNDRVSPARNTAERSAPARSAPEPDDRPVRVQTAALTRDNEPGAAPPRRSAPQDDSRDEDGEGLFRQLPSVSLGGLINRFRGDEEEAGRGTTTANAPQAPTASEQAPSVTGVVGGNGDPIGAVISDAPLPRTSPSAAPASDEPAGDQTPVVVAALPPQRPSLDTLLQGTTALGYADPTATAGPSALGAAEALASQGFGPTEDIGTILEAAARENAPAQDRNVPTLRTTLTAVRGASPALIAAKGTVGGSDFSGFVAPDRNGDGARQVLLAGSFLGAPTGFSSTAPAGPSPDGFRGLRITVFPGPRS